MPQSDAEKALAMLRENDPLSPAEQAALDVINAHRWVLWHSYDRDLCVMLLLSRLGFLRDKEQEAHIARGVEVNMALSERSRRADAHAINTFAWLAGEAADRLDKGVDPNEVAAWLRGQRAAISERHDRERRAPRAA